MHLISKSNVSLENLTEMVRSLRMQKVKTLDETGESFHYSHLKYVDIKDGKIETRTYQCHSLGKICSFNIAFQIYPIVFFLNLFNTQLYLVLKVYLMEHNITLAVKKYS